MSQFEKGFRIFQSSIPGWGGGEEKLSGFATEAGQLAVGSKATGSFPGKAQEGTNPVSVTQTPDSIKQEKVISKRKNRSPQLLL